MKRLIILFLLIMASVVYARSIDINLNMNESYYEDGVNITLLNIDKNKEKFIICVNGKEYIVTEAGISKAIFSIKVKDINKKAVKLEIDIDNKDCDNCRCEGYCNNKRCFPNPKYIPKIKKEHLTKNEVVIKDSVDVGYYIIPIFIILFVAIVILAYYVIKKRY